MYWKKNKGKFLKNYKKENQNKQLFLKIQKKKKVDFSKFCFLRKKKQNKEKYKFKFGDIIKFLENKM